MSWCPSSWTTPPLCAHKLRARLSVHQRSSWLRMYAAPYNCLCETHMDSGNRPFCTLRWSAHPENLFLVEPYVYFPGQSAAVKSLLDSGRYCGLPGTLF